MTLMTVMPVLGAVAIAGDNNLLNALLWIVVAAVVFFVLNWAVGYIGVPEPFGKVAKVVIVIITLILLFNGLFMLVGHPFIVVR